MANKKRMSDAEIAAAIEAILQTLEEYFDMDISKSSSFSLAERLNNFFQERKLKNIIDDCPVFTEIMLPRDLLDRLQYFFAKLAHTLANR